MWRRWGSCKRRRTWSTAFLALLRREYIYIFYTVGFSVPSLRVWCPFSNYFSKCKEFTPPFTFWMIWSGGSVSAIGRLCKLPIFGIFDLCNITRSESTLKSIKLQYGAEIDGWRAKYEEAQVKIWQCSTIYLFTVAPFSNHLLLFTFSFQSLLAQLQNDLGNLKTENRQLSLKYRKDKPQEFNEIPHVWLVL